MDEAKMHKIEQGGDDHICYELFPGIGYTVGLLPPDIRYHHHAAITKEGGPGGSPVAEPGNKNVIDDKGNTGPDKGNIRPRAGIPGELIPDGQIIINPQKHIGKKENRHYSKTLPHAFVPDELFPDVQVEGYDEEHEADGDHKEFHHAGIGAGGVALGGLPEEKGLGTHPECLYEKGDQERELITGGIDADLKVGHGTGETLGEHDPVEGLVDHPSKSGNGEGKGIDHDLCPYRLVEGPFEFPELPAEGDELEGGRDKIGQKDIPYPEAGII